MGARANDQKPDQRSILFQLHQPNLKSDIMNACRQLRPQFFINEALTPTRNRIMFILRRASKKFPTKILNSRSFNGEVVAFTPSSDTQDFEPGPSRRKNKRIFINSMRKLEDFLNREVDSNIDDVLSLIHI